MLLQVQPNSWSCLPTAFAIMLGVPVEELIGHTGHDGSREQWENYRLAWHIQEIAKVCYEVYNVSVTQFEARVMSAPSPEFSPYIQTFDLSEYYKADAGVAGVQTRSGAGHALAYSRNTFYNPSTGGECSVKDFNVHTVWVLNV